MAVNEETALRFSAVYRCVALLAGLVAGLDLNVMRWSDRTKVIDRVLVNPKVGATSYERWETVMTHLLLWGNAYLFKARGGMDQIYELRPIFPGRVDPIVDDDIGPDKVFQVRGKNGIVKPYTTAEILHIPGLSYDGVKGVSPIGLMRQSVGIGLAADELAAKLFGNGSLMSGVLSTDRVLTQDQADALKRRWKEKMAGLGHAHDIAVLDSGTKFQTLTIPPEDAQFLQSRSFQVQDIARFYGVPPHLAGDITNSTSWGTGLEQQQTALVNFTVKAWTTRIDQRLTREILPSTQYARFNLDPLLQGATLDRYNAYAQAIMWGWMTRNEARVKEDMMPIDGLSEPIEPAGKSAITKLGIGGGMAEAIPGAGTSNDDVTPDPGGAGASGGGNQ